LVAVKDAFLGKALEVTDLSTTKIGYLGRIKPLAPNVVPFPTPLDVEKELTEEAHDDEPILRGRIACVFFGYKGLPVDPV
jgi:hypothetical protein